MSGLMNATPTDNLVHYEERMLSSKCVDIKYVLNNEYISITNSLNISLCARFFCENLVL